MALKITDPELIRQIQAQAQRLGLSEEEVVRIAIQGDEVEEVLARQKRWAEFAERRDNILANIDPARRVPISKAEYDALFE